MGINAYVRNEVSLGSAPFPASYMENHPVNQFISVAEINIGIAASCMSVVFVLFKSSTEKTVLFVTKLWSSVTRRSQGGTKTPGGASSISPGPYQEICNKDLPKIPAAEVTGLRSFLRNIGRTNPVRGHRGQSTVMLTDMSEVNDYHDHLRNG